MEDKIFAEVFAVVMLVLTFSLVIGSIGVASTDNCTNITTSSSSNQTILTSSTDTLTAIGDGITSSSANANNQTWLEFDGVDDYVAFYNVALNSPDMSYTAWIKINKMDALDYILWRNDDALGIRASDYNSLAYLSNGTGGSTVGGGDLKIGDWIFISTTYNGSRIIGYENGGIVGSTTNFLSNQSNSFRISGDGNINRNFNGSIDKVKVFNKSLTEEEIISISQQDSYNNFLNESCGIGEILINLDNSVSCEEHSFSFTNTDEFKTVDVNNATDIQVQIDSCSSPCTVTIPSGDYAINHTINLTSDLTINISNGAELYILTNAILTNRSSYEGTNINFIFYAQGKNNIKIINNGAINLIKEYNPAGLDEIITFINDSTNIKIKGGNITTASGFGIYNSENITIYDTNVSGSVDQVYWGECNKYIDIFNINGTGSGEFEVIDSNMGDEYLTINNIAWNGGIVGNDETLDINGASFVSINNINSYGANRLALITTTSGRHFGTCNNTLIGMANTTGTIIFTNGFCYNCNNTIDFVNTNNSYYIKNSSITSNYFNNSEQKKSLVLEINLNENSGTTAHDLSGNGNDGTITGATWNTDGLFVLLTEGVDYSIDTATGLFTILNDDYRWSGIETSWIYTTIIGGTCGILNQTISEIVGAFGIAILAIIGFIGIIGTILGLRWLLKEINGRGKEESITNIIA